MSSPRLAGDISAGKHFVIMFCEYAIHIKQTVTFWHGNRIMNDRCGQWFLWHPHWQSKEGLILGFSHLNRGLKLDTFNHLHLKFHLTLSVETFYQCTSIICSKSDGRYVINDFVTLPLIFTTSKYIRWKFQPCPPFFGMQIFQINEKGVSWA